jgi:ABC-type sugar transport system ATPase subunit
MKAAGISVIFISHKIDEIMELCSRVTILRDGVMIAEKKTEDTNEAEVETLMVGQTAKYVPPEKLRESTKTVLEVRHLSKKNNFKDISFTLHAGEILGITGLLGSGRTELSLALFGVAPADSGEILVDGHKCHIANVQDAVAAGFAYVPEDRLTEGLVMSYSIKENTALATLDKFAEKFTALNFRKIKKTADQWIQILGTKTENSDNPMTSLSGGNQQKVVVSRTLATLPEICIVDEPTRGIDIGAKTEIYGILNDMVKEGKSIIMVTSELPEALGMADRIYVMNEGKIKGELSHDEATQEKIMGLALKRDSSLKEKKNG